jgi:hypothetical protein
MRFKGNVKGKVRAHSQRFPDKAAALPPGPTIAPGMAVCSNRSQGDGPLTLLPERAQVIIYAVAAREDERHECQFMGR